MYPIDNPEVVTLSAFSATAGCLLSVVQDLELKNNMYSTTSPTSNTALSAIKHLCAQGLHD